MTMIKTLLFLPPAIAVNGATLAPVHGAK